MIDFDKYKFLKTIVFSKNEVDLNNRKKIRLVSTYVTWFVSMFIFVLSLGLSLGLILFKSNNFSNSFSPLFPLGVSLFFMIIECWRISDYSKDKPIEDFDQIVKVNTKVFVSDSCFSLDDDVNPTVVLLLGGPGYSLRIDYSEYKKLNLSSSNPYIHISGKFQSYLNGRVLEIFDYKIKSHIPGY